MTSHQHLPASIALESIVITPQLQQRSSREIDLHKENAAFRELASNFASEPDEFLQLLVEQTIRLCDADTVGISVEEVDDKGDKIFRWVAMAGELRHLIGGTTPRNFSPCGVCVDQNRPLLMDRLDRFYPYFREAPLPFVEALLIPWGVSGGPIGTLWIVAHSDNRKFDREDVRLMSCLAAFAAGAIRLKQTVRETERAVAATEVVAAMAHHINNPLQGAILALFCAKAKPDLNPEVRELILIADSEVQRVAALSAELLRKATTEGPRIGLTSNEGMAA
jgi:hypothetical protein